MPHRPAWPEGSRTPGTSRGWSSRRRPRSISWSRSRDPTKPAHKRLARGGAIARFEFKDRGDPPAMPASPWTHERRTGVADDIDFEIKGEELQFVEIELDPGESAVAEAGAMVWKNAQVGMTTV